MGTRAESTLRFTIVLGGVVAGLVFVWATWGHDLLGTSDADALLGGAAGSPSDARLKPQQTDEPGVQVVGPDGRPAGQVRVRFRAMEDPIPVRERLTNQRGQCLFPEDLVGRFCEIALEGDAGHRRVRRFVEGVLDVMLHPWHEVVFETRPDDRALRDLPLVVRDHGTERVRTLPGGTWHGERTARWAGPHIATLSVGGHEVVPRAGSRRLAPDTTTFVDVVPVESPHLAILWDPDLSRPSLHVQSDPQPFHRVARGQGRSTLVARTSPGLHAVVAVRGSRVGFADCYARSDATPAHIAWHAPVGVDVATASGAPIVEARAWLVGRMKTLYTGQRHRAAPKWLQDRDRGQFDLTAPVGWQTAAARELRAPAADDPGAATIAKGVAAFRLLVPDAIYRVWGRTADGRSFLASVASPAAGVEPKRVEAALRESLRLRLERPDGTPLAEPAEVLFQVHRPVEGADPARSFLARDGAAAIHGLPRDCEVRIWITTRDGTVASEIHRASRTREIRIVAEPRDPSPIVLQVLVDGAPAGAGLPIRVAPGGAPHGLGRVRVTDARGRIAATLHGAGSWHATSLVDHLLPGAVHLDDDAAPTLSLHRAGRLLVRNEGREGRRVLLGDRSTRDARDTIDAWISAGSSLRLEGLPLALFEQTSHHAWRDERRPLKRVPKAKRLRIRAGETLPLDLE